MLCALLPTAAAQAGSHAIAAPKITAASASYNTGVLRWSARGADHYEFELAGDAGFNSLLLGGYGHFQTRSTIATLNRTLPDGKYWWRVRAVGKSGSISPWVTRTFTKAWRSPPQLVSPGDNASVKFPTEPLLLTWKPVLGAVTYEVTIAKDQTLTSPISGSPATTTTTSYIPTSTLADGKYFWAVTPVDAERHEGQRSAVRSFTWGWPSATQTNLRDLVDAPELDDPLLTWNPVPGAAKYELDVNFSQDFNASSKVCCSSTQVATGFSPTKILANNTYYWRVRPVNVQGSEGVWTQGATFTKTFDNVPPVSVSSITGLHMRDSSGDGGPKPAGWATSTPMLVWNPVPGASAYDLNVFTMTGSSCDLTQAKTDWHVVTPLTAWAPTVGGHGTLPYPSTGATFEAEGAKLVNGQHYCVRIRAEGDSDTAGARIYGDYTYLNDAFSYVQPATASGALGSPAGSYMTPAGGVGVSSTPIFTWHPIAGANGYWVLVSRDPSFTTLVLYAFTQLTEYVPRHTLADETTSYYWAIIPASNANGSGVNVTPSGASPTNFQKRSTPPTLTSPTSGQELPATQPQFQWSQVPGARTYRLQVSTDPQFGKLLDNVVTPSTSYVSNTTYPAQATLYWRVQVNDDQGTALTWSNPGTFKQVLPAPHPLADNQSAGSSIPTWRWGAVQGAISYDVRVIVPGGSDKVYSGIPTPAFVPVQLSGIGLFRWQVRARFSGSAIGPFSSFTSFRRTATPPTGLRVTAANGRTLLFSWKGRAGVKEYIVQVASDPAFSHGVDTEKTESTAVAPTLFQGGYAKGGLFYYHIAAIDADGNTGAYSPTKKFRFHGPSGH
ncbi:MAG TPA: hypothetical protein VGH82_03075 [Gaiellaceae bacterium]